MRSDSALNSMAPVGDRLIDCHAGAGLVGQVGIPSDRRCKNPRIFRIAGFRLKAAPPPSSFFCLSHRVRDIYVGRVLYLVSDLSDTDAVCTRGLLRLLFRLAVCCCDGRHHLVVDTSYNSIHHVLCTYLHQVIEMLALEYSHHHHHHRSLLAVPYLVRADTRPQTPPQHRNCCSAA